MKAAKKRTSGCNKGTTLVETLAAFVVLAAILAIFYHIVDFSDTLRMQAVDSAHLNQMFLREAYKNDNMIDENFVKITHFTKEGGEGESEKVSGFWLVLDTERTDYRKNYMYDYVEEELLENPPLFRLDNLEATSYRCIDPLIEEENLPVPAILRFEYHKPETATP